MSSIDGVTTQVAKRKTKTRRRAASGDSTVMDDSLILGEGVALNNKDANSPFRLTTTTSNHEEVCKFSLMSTGKPCNKDEAIGGDIAMEQQQYNSLSSFSSIKSKIKAAVQDKYRKSSSTSLSKQIRSKFNNNSQQNPNNSSNSK